MAVDPQPGTLLQDEVSLIGDKEPIDVAPSEHWMRALWRGEMVRKHNRLRANQLATILTELSVLLVHPLTDVPYEIEVVQLTLVKLIEWVIWKPHGSAIEINPLDGRLRVVQQDIVGWQHIPNDFLYVSTNL
jgi:hypothetical protein